MEVRVTLRGMGRGSEQASQRRKCLCVCLVKSRSYPGEQERRTLHEQRNRVPELLEANLIRSKFKNCLLFWILYFLEYLSKS